MPGAYPILYREIKRMAQEVALEAKTARSIVRRSGLRRTVTQEEAPEDFTRTLLSAWVFPGDVKEALQWQVDLTGYTKIRFLNRGPLNPNFFLAYSLDGFASTDLDPGDYALFPTLFPDDPYFYPTEWLEAYSGNSELDGGNPWAEIPEAQRVPMRLSFSLGTGGGTAWNWSTDLAGWATAGYSGPFDVAVQVA